jgi:hypothetical protein
MCAVAGTTSGTAASGDPGLQVLHVLGGEVAADTPVATVDFLDCDQVTCRMDSPDLHHRVGELADHLLLLVRAKDTLDDLR